MYHRQGEGDDGIIVGARKAAGPDTRTVISQITGVGGSQSSKDGEGKDVFHFEDSDEEIVKREAGSCTKGEPGALSGFECVLWRCWILSFWASLP